MGDPENGPDDNTNSCARGFATETRCYLATDDHTIPALEELFTFLDEDGDGLASQEEMEQVYFNIDVDRDGEVTPDELYDYTFSFFNVLCREPGYKAYYYRYLIGRTGYYFYGDNDTMFNVLHALWNPDGRRRLQRQHSVSDFDNLDLARWYLLFADFDAD
jgi:hypothetical protein